MFSTVFLGAFLARARVLARVMVSKPLNHGLSHGVFDRNFGSARIAERTCHNIPFRDFAIMCARARAYFAENHSSPVVFNVVYWCFLVNDISKSLRANGASSFSARKDFVTS